MSNKKLEVKNFKGTINLPYQIQYEVRENYIVLSLNITFDNTVLCADCVSATYNESITEAIEEVINKASEKWNMKLTKEHLKLA